MVVGEGEGRRVSGGSSLGGVGDSLGVGKVVVGVWVVV